MKSKILSIIIIAFISLATFGWMIIIVKSTLMPNIKNGLEVMIPYFFGFPVFIIYNICGVIFARDCQLKRNKFLLPSWILTLLFTGGLTYIVIASYNYRYNFDNLFIVLLTGAVYGFIVTFPTFYNIYLASKNLKIMYEIKAKFGLK